MVHILYGSDKSPPNLTPWLSFCILQPLQCKQLMIIGNCGYKALKYTLSARTWTSAAIAHWIGTVCQSVKKANTPLHAYDISTHNPDKEFPEPLLKLINDTHFMWPMHLAMGSLCCSGSSPKDCSGVWHYCMSLTSQHACQCSASHTTIYWYWSTNDSTKNIGSMQDKLAHEVPTVDTATAHSRQGRTGHCMVPHAGDNIEVMGLL